MVQEIRQIILGVDELVAAVEGYRKVSPEFLPPGKITNCYITVSNMLAVSIEIARDGYSRNAEFTLNNNDLLRPLVCFCLQNGIPLPKDGRKRAVVNQSAALLCITCNLDVEVPAWVVPMRLDQIKSVATLSPADIFVDIDTTKSDSKQNKQAISNR